MWHDNIYWTSGSLERGHFTSSFSGISDSYYNFSYMSNENETFFNYSVETSFTKSPRLVIDYLGRLSDDRGILVDCISRFSGSSKMERCMPAQLPGGSLERGHFTSSFSGISDSYYNFSYMSNENETFFNYSVETSFTKSPRLVIDYLGRLSDDRGILVDCISRFSGSSKMERCMPAQLPGLLVHVANKEENRRANRWWRWLIMAGGAIIISFILATTNNFSAENKLREDGFGLVSK
ncbi:hypothetical protein CFP56_024526, partial [Quercus suber]